MIDQKSSNFDRSPGIIDCYIDTDSFFFPSGYQSSLGVKLRESSFKSEMGTVVGGATGVDYFHDDDVSIISKDRRPRHDTRTLIEGAADIKEIITNLGEDHDVQLRMEIELEKQEEEEDDEQGRTWHRMFKSFFRKMFITLEDSSSSTLAQVTFWVTTTAIFLAILNYLISTEAQLKYVPDTCTNPVCDNDPYNCPGVTVSIMFHVLIECVYIDRA